MPLPLPALPPLRLRLPDSAPTPSSDGMLYLKQTQHRPHLRRDRRGHLRLDVAHPALTGRCAQYRSGTRSCPSGSNRCSCFGTARRSEARRAAANSRALTGQCGTHCTQTRYDRGTHLRRERKEPRRPLGRCAMHGAEHEHQRIRRAHEGDNARVVVETLQPRGTLPVRGCALPVRSVARLRCIVLSVRTSHIPERKASTDRRPRCGAMDRPHPRTHARTHASTHARTHARTRARPRTRLVLSFGKPPARLWKKSYIAPPMSGPPAQPIAYAAIRQHLMGSE